MKSAGRRVPAMWLGRAITAGMLAALCATMAWGQAAAKKTYVLKAARLFDGKSDAVVKPGIVVVTDGRITAVGAKVELPAGAEVIDLGDATLLPGFIDAHTHLTGMYREDYDKAALDNLQKTIAQMAIETTANARVTLMAGVTTVRDVGSRGYLRSEERRVGKECRSRWS